MRPLNHWLLKLFPPIRSGPVPVVSEPAAVRVETWVPFT